MTSPVSNDHELDLDSIPKRFWTRTMADMAEQQHLYSATLRIIAHLAKNEPDAREELNERHDMVVQARRSFEKRRHNEKVVRTLKSCLNRARKLRRSRR